MSRKAFVVRFTLLILIGFAVIVPPFVQSRVLEPFTRGLAATSAAILNVVGQEVSRTGTIIFSPAFSVDIRNGCNGVEAALLLIAAILATPASWRAKLIGVLGGFALLQTLNLIRIASLYLLGRYNRELFDLFHSAVWQVLIILAAVAIFIAWSIRIAARPNPELAA